MDKTQNMDTDQLVKACKDSCEVAYAELVDRYSPRFYSYFMGLTSSREISNDLLSEFYLKVVRNIKNCNSKKFEPWLFRIASNVFYDYLRSRARDKKVLASAKEQIAVLGNKETPELPIKWEQLLVSLDRLDCETRELIVLRFMTGMSFKEIAQEREKPIGTILSKIHRGIKSLRASLAVAKEV